MPAFTPATAAAAARKSHAAGNVPNGLKQAIELQNLAFLAAMSIRRGLSPEGKISREDALALTNLVRAWESCQERIRIHRNKPLPGSCRHVAERVKPVNGKPRNLPPEPARVLYAHMGTVPSASGQAGSNERE